MKEWCRFAACWWHTFNGGMGRDPFSMDKTHVRPWDKDDSMATFEERVNVAFEFFTKLGVDYYCFHDTDVAPQGECLWGTQNMFSHRRFKDGASTSPDFDVFAYACAQTRKMLEVGKKLGAANHVFWGGREGFFCPMNTDVRQELDHMGAFLKMVVDYKAKIGADYQLLIEPKPR